MGNIGKETAAMFSSEHRWWSKYLWILFIKIMEKKPNQTAILEYISGVREHGW